MYYGNNSNAFFVWERRRDVDGVALDLTVLQIHDHPAGTSPKSAFFEEIRNFCLDFTMVVYEKIYFEAYINSQYI